MSSSTYEGMSKYTGEAESSQQRGGSKQQPESSTAQDGKMGKEKKKQERWKQLSHASLGKLIAEAAIQCRHIHLLLCVCQ